MDLRQENSEFTRENFDSLLDQNRDILNQNTRLSKENERLAAEQTQSLEKIVWLQQNLKATEEKLNWLIEQARLNQYRQFSNKSEVGKSLQLELAFDELAKDEAENNGGEVAKESSTETIIYTRNKKSVGRRIDTSKLSREVVVYDLSEAEKSCAKCGQELKQFGEDRSEQLEYIPAQVKVIEHVVPKYKYSCKCCDTVRSASKPDTPLPKSMAGASLITEVIIKKYQHHLPWYRQSQIFAQDGLDIPANTICNWFMQAGEVLEPLRLELKEQLKHTNNLQADETPVKVLKENTKSYMWGYHSLEPNNRFILFEYNESRSGKVASDNLKDYQGILQTDGYAGYNNLRSKGIISIGCWAHCRRHFADVIKISNKAGKAHEVIKWINKLYQIESIAKEQNLDFAKRKELRQKEAPPILDKLKQILTNSSPASKSALGKAINYALNQWEHLIRYIDYGEAEIDNNLIENQIRPFAVGKKNWLFLGNERAAHTASFFYSLIQSCRINNIDPKKYLIYVLKQANRMRRKEVNPKELLPQFIDKNLLV